MQNLVLTNAGQSLLTSVLAELGTISFTKAVSSTDSFSLENIPSLASLTNVKQEVTLTNVEKYSQSQTEIVIDFQGKDISTGYYIKSVGVYASDGTNEILFAVANEDNNVYVNGSSSIVPSNVIYKFYLSVSNSEFICSVAHEYASTEQILQRFKNAGDFTDGKNYFKNDVFTYNNGKYVVDTPFTSSSTPDFKNVYIISQKGYDHFAMEIDATINSNPSVENGGIKYYGGCEGFSQQDWVDWLGYKPCILRGQGAIENYLDPNDYSKDINGNTVDITSATNDSGSPRNVMVRFKRIGLQTHKIKDGKFAIRCTNDPCDHRYLYSSFMNGKRNFEVMFIGAYNGSVSDGKLHSISNADITSTGQSLDSYRTLAQANGMYYNILDVKKLAFLKYLYILQNSTINGVLMSWFDTASSKTGFCNTVGLNKIDTSTRLGKFLGIETNGFSEAIDGVFADADYRLKISDNDLYNNYGTGYIDCGKLYNIGTGYIGNNVSFDVECGIIANTDSGTSTTLFHCPTKKVVSSTFMNTNMTNIFNYEFKLSTTSQLNGCTARLSYLYI